MGDDTTTNVCDDRMRCEVCEQINSKYKCPRCGINTCSLHCVKRHKSTKDCSGVRNKSAFVPIKGFTDGHLLSDYRFLEDVDRKAYSAVTDEATKQHQYTNKIKELRKICKARNIWLKILPSSFSKHKENTSYFHRKQKTIYWRVHWKFPQSDVDYVDRSVSETQTLEDILDTYLDPVKGDPVRRQRLRRYCQQDDLGLYMKIEGTPANSVRYHELDAKNTLCGNLTYKSVIEFPTIHVVLREFANGYKLKGGDSGEIVSQPDSARAKSPSGGAARGPDIEGASEFPSIDTTGGPDGKANGESCLMETAEMEQNVGAESRGKDLAATPASEPPQSSGRDIE